MTPTMANKVSFIIMTSGAWLELSSTQEKIILSKIISTFNEENSRKNISEDENIIKKKSDDERDTKVDLLSLDDQ